jgi:hypothetical protein
MDLYSIAAATGFSILFLLLVFMPMEKIFPAKSNQKILRPYWFTDLCFFLGQYLLWGGLVLWVLNRFGFLIDDIIPFHSGIKWLHSPGGCRQLK